MLRDDIEACARYLVEQGGVNAGDVARVVTDLVPAQIHLGNLALQHGLLGMDGLEQVLEAQQTDGTLFGEKAVELGLFTRPQLDVLLRAQRYRAVLGLAEELAIHGLGEFSDLLELATTFFQEHVLGNGHLPSGSTRASPVACTASWRRP